jgi:hypothetical protein
MLSLGLFFLLLAGATPSLPDAPSNWVHPQDGPHLDFELRVEQQTLRLSVQLNLACADELVGVLREDLNRLDPVEVENLRETLLEFVSEHSELRADGVLLKGTPHHFDWTPPDLERLPYYPRFGTRALTTLRLALEFPAAQAVENLSFSWRNYPPNLTVSVEREDAPGLEVRTRVIAYGTHQAFVLSSESPGLQWTAPPESQRLRMLEVPVPGHDSSSTLGSRPGLWLGLGLGVLGLLIAGRAGQHRRHGLGISLAGFLLALGIGLGQGAASDNALTTADGEGIFLALHTNLYRSFDSTGEEEVYSALATAVAGPLLEELYGDLQQSLSMQEQGGARAEVEDLRHGSVLIDPKSLSPDGFEVLAKWQVDAAVHHFGHFHRRTTGYEARYTLALGPRGWKIQEYDPLAQERLASSTDDPALALSDEDTRDETEPDEVGRNETAPPEAPPAETKSNQEGSR